MLAIVEDFGLDDAHIVKEEWKSVARIIDRFSMRILKLYKTPIAALSACIRNDLQVYAAPLHITLLDQRNRMALLCKRLPVDACQS